MVKPRQRSAQSRAILKKAPTRPDAPPNTKDKGARTSRLPPSGTGSGSDRSRITAMAAGIFPFSFLAKNHPAKQARSSQGMDLIALKKPFPTHDQRGSGRARRGFRPIDQRRWRRLLPGLESE